MNILQSFLVKVSLIANSVLVSVGIIPPSEPLEAIQTGDPAIVEVASTSVALPVQEASQAAQEETAPSEPTEVVVQVEIPVQSAPAPAPAPEPTPEPEPVAVQEEEPVVEEEEEEPAPVAASGSTGYSLSFSGGTHAAVSLPSGSLSESELRDFCGSLFEQIAPRKQCASDPVSSLIANVFAPNGIRVDE